MDAAQFIDGSPGRLVSTSVMVRTVVDGGTELRPVGGVAFVPDALPPRDEVIRELVAALHGDILETERAVAVFNERARALPSVRLLVAPLACREAQASSTIEETVATAEEIAGAQAGDPGSGEDAREVSNYLAALDHGLSSPLPVCVRLMNEMHAILLAGVRGGDKRPGAFRDTQVYIGGVGGFSGARFVPPPPGALLFECMAGLERFLNGVGGGGRARLPALLEIALGHYQFECVHPYRDGNGRLGRLLISLALSRGAGAGGAGGAVIPFSVSIERGRQEYYDRLLRVSTRGEWEAWCRYMLSAIRVQAIDGAARLAHLRRLRERMIERATSRRTSPGAAVLIDAFFARPSMTAAQAGRVLGVRSDSAKRTLDGLVRAGVLTVPEGRGYRRLYTAREVLAVIETEHLEPL